MFKCRNGHQFSESEARGKIIRYASPFLICPFCGDEVYGRHDDLGKIFTNLSEHERKLDELTEKFENLMRKSETRQRQSKKKRENKGGSYHHK